MVQHRRAQLVQSRERQLDFRLNTHGPLEAALRHQLAREVVEQGRLSDSSFALHDQHLADPIEDAGNERAEGRTLWFPPAQLRGHRAPRRGERRQPRRQLAHLVIKPPREAVVRMSPYDNFPDRRPTALLRWETRVHSTIANADQLGIGSRKELKVTLLNA